MTFFSDARRLEARRFTQSKVSEEVLVMSEPGPNAHIRWAGVTRSWALRPTNPSVLMRPCDRLETTIRILAVLAVAALIPISAALGTSVYTTVAGQVEVEQRSRTPVDAVIIGEPSRSGLHAAEAKVSWEHRGHRGEADVAVAPTAVPGDRITLWVDDAGRRTGPPRHSSAAATSGVTVAVAVVVSAGFAAWATVGSVSWLLSRRRNSRWDREWRALTGTTENLT